jgi:hypothetical protein
MIVSTSLAKVGHRQAPHTKKPIPPYKEGWVFYFANADILSVLHRIFKCTQLSNLSFLTRRFIHTGW